MAILTLNEVRSAAEAAYGRRFTHKSAAAVLIEETASAPAREQFDVFLSHSYTDAQLADKELLGLWEILRKLGLKVYIDWIVDRHLSRKNVTSRTAQRLRQRMDDSRCLFFATSQTSASSKWMPWELGYKDGENGKVAILPLTGGSDFKGQEYLGIYPYIDLTSSVLYVHRNQHTWVRFSDWLAGKEPTERS